MYIKILAIAYTRSSMPLNRRSLLNGSGQGQQRLLFWRDIGWQEGSFVFYSYGEGVLSVSLVSAGGDAVRTESAAEWQGFGQDPMRLFLGRGTFWKPFMASTSWVVGKIWWRIQRLVQRETESLPPRFPHFLLNDSALIFIAGRRSWINCASAAKRRTYSRRERAFDRRLQRQRIVRLRHLHF